MKIRYRSTLIALIAATAAGAAVAGGGDNGMNPFYGDSWAALEGHGVNLSGAPALPGADVAHAGTATHAFQSLAERMNHAEATMSENWHRAAASMANATQRMETPAPVRATQPIVSTPTNPFDEKAGN